MAVTEAKSGKDVRCYEKAVEALAKAAPQDSEAVLDTEWVDRTLKTVKAETDRLEHELKGYKNNLIKESIRMGNEDLGQHYHRTGDLLAASKAYARMRDYCTTTPHIASMLFKNLIVAVDRSDWLGVQTNVNRLRNLQFKPEDETKNKAKMWATLGLSQLAMGAYREAATSFISTDPCLGDSFKEVISPNDVAVYGGLCALASMSREELHTHVLENKSFRNFLELEPHIRRAISFFCASKFRPCLDILDAYRGDYLLDIHLQKHVPVLYGRIRTKAIQQYIIPYNRITLASMAAVFSPDGGEGEAEGSEATATATATATAAHTTNPNNDPFVQELITLIQSSTLNARIDMEKGVLVINQNDTRQALQAAALKNVSDYADAAHIQLLRVNIVHAGLEVPPPNAGGGGSVAGGTGGIGGGGGGGGSRERSGDPFSAELKKIVAAGKLGKAAR
ncbi:hypothetical protein AJ80_05208 [Polytolypa hystricis UAMH7299]|uniref:COP9 signalosome complex subunit 1 n=1 Tax=Polytolypa hystricis (strain UAMH7299) TaxID=1447883 RepID=A0A2B7Y659_POLH7|nr:hypothetical protein AJ80_05208 [Polytolypa hystricis UAMH7299]